MKQHGRMNRTYRLVWSRCRQGWVVAPETARGGGGRSGGGTVASPARGGESGAAGVLGGMAFAAALALGQVAPVAAQSVEAEGDVTPWVGGVDVPVFGDWYVGHVADGSVFVRDGGHILSGSTTTIGDLSTSTGTVKVSGVSPDGLASTLRLHGDLLVARLGTGTLRVQDGGQVTQSSGVTRIGSGENSTGTVEVSGVNAGVYGSTSTLTLGESLLIGEGTRSTATLRVQDGGQVTQSSGNTLIAYGENSTGTVVVLGMSATGQASALMLDKALYVGRGEGSIGTLRVLAGGQVTQSSGIVSSTGIAYGDKSTGTVEVSGVSATGQASELRLGGGSIGGGLEVGHGEGSTATLRVQAGGQVTTGSEHVTIIAYGDKSTGTVEVSGVSPADGLASTLWLHGDLSVGGRGTGTLRVQAGGQVTQSSGITIIGSGENSTGTVEVSGTSPTGQASALALGGTLIVGDNGTGELVVTEGGRLTQSTGDTRIGESSNVSGTVILAKGGLMSNPSGVVKIASNFNTRGTLVLGAPLSDTPVAAGQLVASQVRFGAGTGQIVFNHTGDLDGSAVVFDGQLDGPGRLTQANGTTRLSANSYNFTGSVDVQGGTLVVDGYLASPHLLTVRDQGTLAGRGTVGNTEVQAGGRLAPGDTGGTLHVAGNLTLAPGAALDMALGSPGTAGQPSSGITERIEVAGDLALNGTVNLAQSGHPGDGTVAMGYYRLITYEGDLTANTAAIGTTPNLADAQYELQVGAKWVDLLVQVPDDGGDPVDPVEPVEPEVPVIPGDNRLQYWQGGSGIWAIDTSAWRNHGGEMTVDWAGHDAVFGDTATAVGGTVTVEGYLPFQGLQFVGEGYRLIGPGSLVTADTGSEVRMLADHAELAVAITGAGALRKTEAGTLVLTGANSYTGGTEVMHGTLVGDASAIRGPIRNAGVVVFEQATDGQVNGSITGLAAQRGVMVKQGEGELTLSAPSSLDWRVVEGGLTAPAAVFTGDADIQSGARLTLTPGAGQASYAGRLSGAGTLRTTGAATSTGTGDTGALVLTGDSAAFTGATQVVAGTLQLDGTLGGDLEARAGGTFTGTGELGGNLDVTGGGVLAGASGQQLRIAGDVRMDDSSTLHLTLGAAVPGPSATLRQRVTAGDTASDALFAVGGDLTLAGTLRVQDAGGFGAGVYRLFDYAGTLTDQGLAFAPDTVAADNLRLQTAVAGRVNLVSTVNAALGFWDGGDAAQYDNGVVDGGSGVWRTTGRAWTLVDGQINGAPQPDPVFAVFQGQPGTVTVAAADGAVRASGLQFVTDGYHLSGDAIVLAGGAQATVRVGDGTAAGAATQATIAAELAGSAQLVKDDLGTLVLTGANTYRGGTRIAAGTLQLGDGGNTGAVRGAIINQGALVLNRSDQVVMDNPLSGTGVIRQEGRGRVVLDGVSDGFTGSTVVTAGVLTVNGTLGGTLEVQEAARLEGSGTVGTTVVAGTLAPGNTLGTLRIAGDLTLLPQARLDMVLGRPGSASQPDTGITDRIDVSGDLTLRGTVNLWQSRAAIDGRLGAGYYRLITYGGELIEPTAVIGTTPALAEAQYALEAGSGRVDLVIRVPATGGEPVDPGAPGNDRLQHWQGGSGVWSATDPSWRNLGSETPVTWAGHHAVFRDSAGQAGGTVTVAGPASFQSLQFVDEGFRLDGTGALATVAGGSEIRVLATQAEIATAITGPGALRKTEAGTLVLSGANTYTGGTRVERGTLVGDVEAIRGAIQNAGTVVFDQATDARLADTITGIDTRRGVMVKQGAGELTLAAQSSLDWRIEQGGLTAQAETFTGDARLQTDARLTLAHAAGQARYAGVLSGEGTLRASGDGTLVLAGDSAAFTGTTEVVGGTLQLDGTLGGNVQARAGSALTGTGRVAGALDVTAGGVLAGASGEQLRIAGDVLMDDTSALHVRLGAVTPDASATLRQRVAAGDAASDALFAVGGNLTLAGTLRVQDAGGFGAGVYRLFDYAGTLTDQGLAIAPDAVAADSLRVQTAVAGRVNLVSTAQATLGFWDGDDTTQYDNGVIDGGSGVWRSTGRAWTTLDGQLNGAPQPDPIFAVFQGQSGTVTVAAADGEIRASGLQFVTDGYHLAGDAIALSGGAQAMVRVGDGTAAGAATQATIAAALTGSAQLVKDDVGTLILTGTNTYDGGTRIEAGTLQLGDGGSTGAVRGVIINDGTLALHRSDQVVMDNPLTGTGVIRQVGRGQVVLAGESRGFSASSYTHLLKSVSMLPSVVDRMDK